MKNIFLIISVIFIVLSANAQNYSADFTKALRENDIQKQKNIITAWQQSSDRSADYYISVFNYYLTGSLDATQHKVDIETLNKSLSLINEGIEKYPNRLDMRLGELEAMQYLGLWDDATQKVISAIDYSYIIDNKWIYPDENADKDFFLGNMQQKILKLFDEVDFETLDNSDIKQLNRIQTICSEMLRYYPNSVEALDDMGATYFYMQDNQKALEYFQKAEQIAPKDAVTLFNIANIYKIEGNKEKAKLYYENIIKNCDPDAANQANILLKELQ